MVLKSHAHRITELIKILMSVIERCSLFSGSLAEISNRMSNALEDYLRQIGLSADMLSSSSQQHVDNTTQIPATDQGRMTDNGISQTGTSIGIHVNTQAIADVNDKATSGTLRSRASSAYAAASAAGNQTPASNPGTLSIEFNKTQPTSRHEEIPSNPQTDEQSDMMLSSSQQQANVLGHKLTPMMTTSMSATEQDSIHHEATKFSTHKTAAAAATDNLTLPTATDTSSNPLAEGRSSLQLDVSEYTPSFSATDESIGEQVVIDSHLHLGSLIIDETQTHPYEAPLKHQKVPEKESFVERTVNADNHNAVTRKQISGNAPVVRQASENDNQEAVTRKKPVRDIIAMFDERRGPPNDNFQALRRAPKNNRSSVQGAVNDVGQHTASESPTSSKLCTTNGICNANAIIVEPNFPLPHPVQTRPQSSRSSVQQVADDVVVVGKSTVTESNSKSMIPSANAIIEEPNFPLPHPVQTRPQSSRSSVQQVADDVVVVGKSTVTESNSKSMIPSANAIIEEPNFPLPHPVQTRPQSSRSSVQQVADDVVVVGKSTVTESNSNNTISSANAKNGSPSHHRVVLNRDSASGQTITASDVEIARDASLVTNCLPTTSEAVSSNIMTPSSTFQLEVSNNVSSEYPIIPDKVSSISFRATPEVENTPVCHTSVESSLPLPSSEPKNVPQSSTPSISLQNNSQQLREQQGHQRSWSNASSAPSVFCVQSSPPTQANSLPTSHPMTVTSVNQQATGYSSGSYSVGSTSTVVRHTSVPPAIVPVRSTSPPTAASSSISVTNQRSTLLSVKSASDIQPMIAPTPNCVSVVRVGNALSSSIGVQNAFSGTAKAASDIRTTANRSPGPVLSSGITSTTRSVFSSPSTIHHSSADAFIAQSKSPTFFHGDRSGALNSDYSATTRISTSAAEAPSSSPVWYQSTPVQSTTNSPQGTPLAQTLDNRHRRGGHSATVLVNMPSASHKWSTSASQISSGSLDSPQATSSIKKFVPDYSKTKSVSFSTGSVGEDECDSSSRGAVFDEAPKVGRTSQPLSSGVDDRRPSPSFTSGGNAMKYNQTLPLTGNRRSEVNDNRERTLRTVPHGTEINNGIKPAARTTVKITAQTFETGQIEHVKRPSAATVGNGTSGSSNPVAAGPKTLQTKSRSSTVEINDNKVIDPDVGRNSPPARDAASQRAVTSNKTSHAVGETADTSEQHIEATRSAQVEVSSVAARVSIHKTVRLMCRLSDAVTKHAGGHCDDTQWHMFHSCLKMRQNLIANELCIRAYMPSDKRCTRVPASVVDVRIAVHKNGR
jgi:hypothetical protein